jgi:hypothetical protein
MTDAGALEATITQQVITALKARDQVRTGTLRLIKNALKNKAIEKRGPLTPVEEQQTLTSMVKHTGQPARTCRHRGGRDCGH